MGNSPRLPAEASDFIVAAKLRRWYRAQSGLPKVAPLILALFVMGVISVFANIMLPLSEMPTTDWAADMRKNLETVTGTIGIVMNGFLILPGLCILGVIGWKVIAMVMYRRIFHKIAVADANSRTPRAWYEYEDGKKVRKLSTKFTRYL